MASSSPQKKVITIVGVTGSQGGSVLSTFIELPEWHVRGITRNTGSESAKALAAKGVELVVGDLDDVESLKTAFENTHAIFAVTDFWMPFFDPSNIAKAKEQGISINQFCYDLELRRGKNIASAAASIPTLERLVYSTLSNTKELSGGKYTQIYHFDSKAAVVSHIRSSLPELAAKMSTIQVGFFYVNFLNAPMMQPQEQEDGTFAFMHPCKGSAKHPFIDVPRDVGKFVKVLIVDEKEAEKSLLAYSQYLSYDEVCAMWSRVTGRSCVFKQEKVDVLGEMFPPIGEEGVEPTAYSAEFGYDGGEKGVLKLEDLNIETKGLEEWMSEQDWTPVIGA